MAKQVKYRIVDPAGRVRHEFNDWEMDGVPDQAFEWLLKNQSSSVYEALANQGWRVERWSHEWVLESAWTYKGGYEEVVAAEDRRDALQLLAEYQENEPGVPHRVRVKQTWIMQIYNPDDGGLKWASVPRSFIDKVGSFSATHVLREWSRLSKAEQEAYRA